MKKRLLKKRHKKQEYLMREYRLKRGKKVTLQEMIYIILNLKSIN
jgi:hypothetical protein